MQRGLAPVFILLMFAVLAISLAGSYLLVQNKINLPAPGGQACTLEAMICPDGSSVGRTGPNCEFAPCPSLQPTATASSSAETADWKTYTGGRYSFIYPKDWSSSQSEYLNTVDITNPQKTVTIVFSDEQYPFGFENAGNKFDKNKMDIDIAGKNYNAEEVIVNDSSAFVNFRTDVPKVVYILFGTGYPAGSNTSLTDYQSSRVTILKILSTFKFN